MSRWGGRGMANERQDDWKSKQDVVVRLHAIGPSDWRSRMAEYDEAHPLKIPPRIFRTRWWQLLRRRLAYACFRLGRRLLP